MGGCDASEGLPVSRRWRITIEVEGESVGKERDARDFAGTIGGEPGDQWDTAHRPGVVVLEVEEVVEHGQS